MPVIAILIDSYTTFQRRYVDSIAVRLKTHGFGVVVVSGRELKPDEISNQPTYNHANRIFSIAKSYDVCGYVLLTGCFGHNLCRSELDGFVQAFTSSPTVSLGINVPSAYSISSQNQPGMRQLMEHLTEEGWRKNFVFIRGFKNHIDSIERESVFREVLEERGIPVKEHLILTGNYHAVDAYRALDPVLALHPEIDAVVAANDDMAAAAIQVLKKHNLRIPEDVVVSGFDNSSIAKETSPPLTSVQQPFEEHVAVTVNALISMIRNPDKQRANQPSRSLNCNLVIRESSSSAGLQNVSTELAFSGSPDEAWDHFFDTFIAKYEPTLKHSDEGCYEHLFLLIRDRLKIQPDGINDLFREFYRNDAYCQRELGWWLQFEYLLSALVLHVSRAGIFSQYITLLLELQMQVRSYNSSLESSLAFDAQQDALLHARFETMLAKCKVVDDIKHVLDIYFSQHNVGRAFLVLYNSKSGSVDCLANVFYIFRSNKSENDDSDVNEYGSFESKDILPKSLKDEINRGTLILDPLYVDDVHLGYSLMDPEGVSALNHIYFSCALSNTLNRCHGVSQIQRSTTNKLH